MHYIAYTVSRELFRLAMLAVALGVAFGAAKLFGVSLALGTFFAGMIMSEREIACGIVEQVLEGSGKPPANDRESDARPAAA